MKNWPELLEKYWASHAGRMVPHERNSRMRELEKNRSKVAEVMESQAQLIRAAIPRLKLEPYAVASGHKVSIRMKCSAPGFKTESVGQRFDIDPDCILAALIPGLGPLLPGLVMVCHDARTVLREELEKELGKRIKKAISDALSAGVDDLEAQRKVQANRERAERSKRQAALVRLAECMEGHDYSEEDVLEAWRMSQVKRIQSS